MLMLHCFTFAGFMAIFTFWPTCSSDSPCYFPVISGLVLYAFSFALWQQIYCMVFLVVKENMQSTAYGIMVSFYNTGLTAFPILIGYIQDQTYDEEYKGYYWVGVFFLGEIGFSFLVLLVIMYVDKTRFGNSLSKK